MSQPRTQFFYLRDQNRKPIGALAFVVLPADQELEALTDRLAEAFAGDAAPQEAIDGLKQALGGRPRVPGYGCRIAVALCHPDDEFSKHKARTRALGRVQSRLSSFFSAGLSDNGGQSNAILEALSVELVFKTLGFPVREEIDYASANALFKRQLERELEIAIENDPDPALAPVPEDLPKLDPELMH